MCCFLYITCCFFVCYVFFLWQVILSLLWYIIYTLEFENPEHFLYKGLGYGAMTLRPATLRPATLCPRHLVRWMQDYCMSLLYMRKKFKLIPGILTIKLNLHHETNSNANILKWLTFLHHYHKRICSTSLPAMGCFSSDIALLRCVLTQFAYELVILKKL